MLCVNSVVVDCSPKCKLSVPGPACFLGLGEVLYQLSQRHRDVDIRDRATLYYTLITSLAPHKVRTGYSSKSIGVESILLYLGTF